MGHAHGLAALFAVVTERPLYVSYDLAAKVFDLAIQLLKRAGEHDVSVAGTEVEVAWTCIASLMALGPNFVRTHLPQLLVLWRNALPKPTSKDTTPGSGRSSAEWSFLLQVREAALTAILGFLRHNSTVLVTLDVSRRLALLLANALTFANAFAAQQQADEALETINTAATLPGLETPLSAREAMLRRRVYQCFTALGFSTVTEAMQVTLLKSTATLFASPEGYAGSSIQAAIASSAGTLSSIWSTADGYAYGIASWDLTHIGTENSDANEGEQRDRLNRDTIDALIDNTVSLSNLLLSHLHGLN